MRTLSVTTEIDAPPSTVWRLLVAWGDYSSWNPFITSIEGDLAVGGRLRARIRPPGGSPMTFRPTVTIVREQRTLEWVGHLVVPGLFTGRHSFQLERLGAHRSRLTQAEVFTGLLVPITGATLARTLQGFHSMNEALRQRAEQDAAYHRLDR